MKNFINGVIASFVALLGLLLLFFRRSKSATHIQQKHDELSRKSLELKNEIAKSTEERKAPAIDLSLEEELEYWKKHQ